MARSLRRRFSTAACILLYHRVERLDTDPQLLAVTPAHFREHLAVLRRSCSPISLRQLCTLLEHGHALPTRAVVVTFDDGYIDNLAHAKPALSLEGIPATVFVTAGQVGATTEFWWDEVERFLLQPSELPTTLRVKAGTLEFDRELNGAALYGRDECERNRHWNVSRHPAKGSRQEVYRDLCEWLRPMPSSQRDEALAALRLWAGVEAAGRKTHRTMTDGELLELDDDLIEVGAHSQTHPMLSQLTVPAQRVEISECKERLEKCLGRSVSVFSYPYGSHTDYSAETVRLVRDAGFSCACANVPDLVFADTSPYELPRFIVRDWNGDEFGQQLERWFTG